MPMRAKYRELLPSTSDAQSAGVPRSAPPRPPWSPCAIDPELRHELAQRARHDETTTSEVIREALRRFLHAA